MHRRQRDDWLFWALVELGRPSAASGVTLFFLGKESHKCQLICRTEELFIISHIWSCLPKERLTVLRLPVCVACHNPLLAQPYLKCVCVYVSLCALVLRSGPKTAAQRALNTKGGQETQLLMESRPDPKRDLTRIIHALGLPPKI